MVSKLELGGVIHAKREDDTIWEPPYREKETHGVTQDFNEWSKHRSSLLHGLTHKDHLLMPQTEVHDQQIATYISKHFEGYMLDPVVLVDGVAVVAQARYLETIDEINDIKKYLDLEPGKKYLCDVQYLFPRWVIWKMDTVTFSPILLDKPMATKSGWKIRYGVLKETDD